jgi:hypothetical protein
MPASAALQQPPVRFEASVCLLPESHRHNALVTDTYGLIRAAMLARRQVVATYKGHRREVSRDVRGHDRRRGASRVTTRVGTARSAEG